MSAQSLEPAMVCHLREIYDDAVAERLARDIRLLAERFRGAAETSASLGRLDQGDVLLITYADTLLESGSPPLEVLHRFYHQHLRGVFTLVHILPFHPYSSDDGFSVIDYYRVREELGNWQNIAALASECRIMADAVINHMSSESVWFREFLANNADYSAFFYEASPQDDLSTVVRPRTSPLLTRFSDVNGKERHVWTTFSADQVDLNFRNPKVLLAIIEVLFFLISRGARLLRLDAVTFLWKAPGTSCANLRETHLLIKVMRAAVLMLRDDVVVITETNVPHRENIAYFGNGHDEAHMVYNFALPPLLAHSFITGNSRRLRHWARTLSLPSKEVCFLNFSASHDGVGVRPVEEILDDNEIHRLVNAAEAAGGRVSSRTLGDGRAHPYELNCTFLDLISAADEDVETLAQRFVASQAIVLAMPGVPAIYIQSLLGTRNDLERVRQTGRARSINRSKHDYATITARLRQRDGLEGRVFDRLTGLIKIRQAQAAFDPHAGFEVLDAGDNVFAMVRGNPGNLVNSAESTVCCIVSLVNEPATVTISRQHAGINLLDGKPVAAGQHTLAPYQILWLKSQPSTPETT